MYVPLELTVGGRINYSFKANSAQEIREINSLLQREIKMKFGGRIKCVSGSLEGDIKNKNSKSNVSKSLDKIEDLSIKIEGGDYTYKEDFKKWIQSFNMDNLQIIEYKSLQPIYCFIPGLESKLTICLENYEDIVLKEIYTLMEKDFNIKEKEIFAGSSDVNNFWKVGLTHELYKKFIIYRRKIVKNLSIKRSKEIQKTNEKKKMNTKINDAICGEIPDGFIICGWILKTNANSNYHDVVANWERKKTVGIIGNECFKFKVDLNVEEKDINEDIDIDWSLEIFCIHNNFLLEYDKNNYRRYQNHFFINCDCNSKSDDTCYYNQFFENNKETEKVNLTKQETKDIKDERGGKTYAAIGFNNINNLKSNTKINPLMPIAVKIGSLGCHLTTLFG